MSGWQSTVSTDGTVNLPPDPRALEALGHNHTLKTALADLVDNSIDAAASQVLIRFIQRNGRLVALCVVDDGRGISPDAIDDAMTIGGRRRYDDRDLGHFGLGLKAASFSQADSLTVVSRAAGAAPVGRRWLLEEGRRTFACDRVSEQFVIAELDRPWPVAIGTSGTVVRWDKVRNFPASADHVHEYLDRTINEVRGHLGLTFHRILAEGRVTVSIDVEDVDLGAGPPMEVTPLDPFRYPDVNNGWPRRLTARDGSRTLVLTCHIWPGRSNTPEYRLPGGAEERQGLYVYRRDRLLQAGGWEGITAPDRTLQLARVAVELDSTTSDLFTMNPEKSKVSAGPDFAMLVQQARASDGTTISDYLKAAEGAWRTATQRTRSRQRVVPPGRGIDSRVSRVIREELPQLNVPALDIKWTRLDHTLFFEVDRTANTLWLNKIYRPAILAGRRGGGADAPVLKALLYLLVENVFQGEYLGARDKDNIELWQNILTKAASVEKSNFEDRI
jgi:hypothetical protein